MERHVVIRENNYSKQNIAKSAKILLELSDGETNTIIFLISHQAPLL